MADQTSITLTHDAKAEVQRFKSDGETWNDAFYRIAELLSKLIREADEDIVGEAATEAEALERLLNEFDGNMFDELDGSEPPEVRLVDETHERIDEHVEQAVRDTVLELG